MKQEPLTSVDKCGKEAHLSLAFPCMKIHLIFMLVITSYFLFSCNSNSISLRNEKEMIEIDLDREDRISIKDLFSKVEIIPLETNKNSLLSFPIGEPDRIIVNEKKYYFLDQKQNVIVVFNPDGSFLKTINKKGNGPEEYVSLDDIAINRFSGNLEVLSSIGRYINVYNASNDTLIERIKFPEKLPVVHNFHHLTSDIYVFFAQPDKAEIYFYSKNSKEIIQSDYSLPEWFNQKTVFVTTKNPFYVYNDSLRFVQIYNGDVFSISPADYKLHPKFIWNFGQANFAPDVLPKDKSMEYYLDLLKKISINYAVLFQIYQENSNYYFTRFKFKNRYKHLVFDKKKNEYMLFEKFKEGGQCVPQWIDEEAIYTFIPPAFIHLIINESFFNEEDKSKYLLLKEDENPVVIKYNFK
jgi:hypothetical protein